ncbi:MAG: hypothetical protein J6112_04350 [Clostridia bacterium]|nr:hypothetical protein [Clostridia bacterium]
MFKTFFKSIIVLLILPVLLSGLVSCVPASPETPAANETSAPENPEPTFEIPVFTPSDVEFPDSYVFFDLAMTAVKSRAARYFKDLRNDIFIKTGKPYGFCGNVSFEYSVSDASLVPFEVSGVVYAPLEGLAKAFGAECYEENGSVIVNYQGVTAAASLAEDKITIGGNVYAFRKPEKVGSTYYVDAAGLGLLFDYAAERSGDTIQMTAKERYEKMDLNEANERFGTYDAEIYKSIDVDCDTTGSGLYPPVDPSERQVGIAYTTWFRSDWKWGEGHTWDIPWLGSYSSLDRNVIKQHGIWLRDAGVDFVFVDWSNNINYIPETMRKLRADFRTIEDATEALFDVWADIPGAPKICIFTGPGHEQGPGEKDTFANGRMAAKTDQIYNTFLANERYRKMYYEYLGKPLLLCYAATPAFFQDNVSPYEDDRFTVRWVTGFVGQQGNLFDSETLISKIFWSWEERGAQTFTVLDGHPECMTVNASTRSQGKTPGTAGYIAPALRDNGNTFRRAWARARLIGPKLVLVVSFNEWTLGEQISLENSKDIEPSKTLGSFYLDLMREEIRRFKGKSK